MEAKQESLLCRVSCCPVCERLKRKEQAISPGNSDPGHINESNFTGTVGAVEKQGECRNGDSGRGQLSRSLDGDIH